MIILLIDFIQIKLWIKFTSEGNWSNFIKEKYRKRFADFDWLIFLNPNEAETISKF